MATHAREKIEAWLDNPNTPKDAWKSMSQREIAEAANVSKHAVFMHLSQIIAERTGEDAIQIEIVRQETAFEKGTNAKRIPLSMQQEMKHAKFVLKKNLKTISQEFNISYSGVQKFFKRLEKQSKE